MRFPQVFNIGSIEISLYNVGLAMALIVPTIYNLLVAKAWKLPKWKVFIMTILWYATTWGLTYAMAYLEFVITDGATGPIATNGIRAYLFLPFYYLFIGWIMKEKKARVMDMLTPGLPLGVAIGHFGCQFAGCCHGYPYDGPFKIWSPVAGQFVFPVQLLECIAVLCIFVFLNIYSMETQYQTTGKQYPLWLFLFGISRFFFEFLRDNIKILWGCSSLALYALAEAIVGAVWLIMLTPPGRVLCARIRNLFRRLTKKPALDVPSAKEMKEIIKQERLQSIKS